MKNLIFTTNDVLHIIRNGATSNEKIAKPGEVVVQTYHFDRAQFEFVKNGGKGVSTKTGFLNPELTAKNCGGCPLRHGGCYTFKFTQAMGHLSMLRSVVKQYGTFDRIPGLMGLDLEKLAEATAGRYVRFGAYGNPDTMPLDVVEFMCNQAKTWTGYTHNWKQPAKFEYLKYFMASAHSDKTEWAPVAGIRSFVTDGATGVQCPASDEYYNKTGKKVTCSQCGLCSGLKGKGKGNVRINSH